MAWSGETGGLAAQVEAYLRDIADAHTRSTTLAWVRAWDVVGPELEAALNELAMQAVDGRLRRADVIRSVRLQFALEHIHDTLGELVTGSASEMIDRLVEVVEHAGSMQDRLIASQLPTTERNMVIGWSRVDPRAVDSIVTRTSEQITKLSYPLTPDTMTVMRRELVRGMVIGSNPREVATKMLRQTEGLFNGGLYRANVIARTEMADAHRAASFTADQANADVLRGWVWTCDFSSRTCQACLSMHGREFPLEQPGPEGHQNCRCARVALTKSWADLGITGIEEPEPLIGSAQDYFDSLPVTDQQAILGRRGLAAYEAGDFPIEDWAVRQDNPGWRPSWVPASAPAP